MRRALALGVVPYPGATFNMKSTIDQIRLDESKAKITVYIISIAELEAEAKPLGERLCAEKPRQIGARHARYWDAWQGRQRRRSATGDEPVAASS